jgi:hypothetical protein
MLVQGIIAMHQVIHNDRWNHELDFKQEIKEILSKKKIPDNVQF